MASKNFVQYINPHDISFINYNGKEFTNTNRREKTYTISRVFYEDIITYSFKIPSNQAQNDISSIVEIKMYEEAGLDIQKRYKITYLVKTLDFEEMSLVEVFAVDLEMLDNIFAKELKKIKYIDFLILPFLSFETLYTNKILTPKNDIFVYMDSNEAFLSIYKNGSYISTKTLINISDILEKLQIQGIELTLDELYSKLLKKGFNVSLYEPGETDFFNALETIFSEILTKINNIAMHNRSVFGFDRIDRIIFSTRKGRIKGLREFIHNFGFSEIEILDFNLFKQKQDENFLEYISLSYGYDKFINNSNEQNITIYHRPAPFLSTYTGKLLTGSIALLIILSSVYAYFLFDLQKLQEEESILQSKYNAIKKVIKKYKKDISNKNVEISKIRKEIKKQNIFYKNIEASINKLENLQNEETDYVGFLARVNKLLKKYNLKTKSIYQEGKSLLIVEVISTYKRRDKIAQFIKSLINEGFIDVSTDEIRLDENSYISKVVIHNE